MCVIQQFCIQEDLIQNGIGLTFLNKFQQNLNILTDINTTMGIVFVKQREFVQRTAKRYSYYNITD
jgi:hypothetical protein